MTKLHQLKILSFSSFMTTGCPIQDDGGTAISVTDAQEPDEAGEKILPTGYCDFENYGDGIYNFECENYGSTKNSAKQYTGGDDFYMPYVNACAYVEPSTDQDWEDKVRAKCSVVCGKTAYPPRVCDDANWSLIKVVGVNCTWQVCPQEACRRLYLRAA